MRIVLVGMPGSGKTTLGKQAARALGLSFRDSDAYIIKICKMRISKIFEYVGESGFRKIEQISLHKILRQDNIILSTGGGMPCFNENMQYINKKTISIFLNPGEDELFRRLQYSGQNRPLIKNLTGSELKEYINKTMTERGHYYSKAQFEYDFKKDFVKFLNEDILPNIDI